MELTPEERERIYAEEKLKKEAQEQLEKEKKAKNTKQGCFGCLGIIVIILIVGGFFGSCGSTKPENTPPKPASSSSNTSSQGTNQKMSTKIAGQDAIVNINALLATSEQSYDMLFKYINANNKDAIARMMVKGEVVPVNKGDKVTIIESGFASVHVELISGQYAGVKGWLPREFID